jgi:hypothetical protein
MADCSYRFAAIVQAISQVRYVDDTAYASSGSYKSNAVRQILSRQGI